MNGLVPACVSAAKPTSPTITVVGNIGGPGQDPATVNVRFDEQTGRVRGWFSYSHGGAQLVATPTCFRYRELAPAVYDVVITRFAQLRLSSSMWASVHWGRVSA